MADIINGDLVVTGAIYGPTDIDYPAGSIENVDVSASAAVAASKLQKSPVWIETQTGTAETQTYQTFIKGSTGTLKHLTVVCGTACSGSSTVTVDLQVDGVSVLATALTINSSTTPNSELTATIDTPGVTDGERLSVVITATQSGSDALATDVGFRLDWDEDYAS